MVTNQTQAELLRLMVQLQGGKRGIEIGTFTGYSSICMAEGLPEGGKLVCFDSSEEFTDLARKYWDIAGVTSKIDLRIGNAEEELKKFLEEGKEAETYDFAYVDANKSGYDTYYELLLKLLRKGGFIAFDNVLWKGHVVGDKSGMDADTLALRELAEKINKDERVDMAMVGLGDGVLFAYKK